MKLEGIVRWFDNTSGEGIVSGIDGNDYYCHWSAVQGKFPAKNGKKSWAELERGWKVEFEVYQNLHSSMVNKLWIVEKAEPRPVPSAYIDRDQMKAKLAAANAAFDETFPECSFDWDEWYKLTRTIKKLTKKQEKRLADIEAMKELHDLAVKRHNEDKNRVIVSIYREHSRYPLCATSEK